jgi:hypothetical protein
LTVSRDLRKNGMAKIDPVLAAAAQRALTDKVAQLFRTEDKVAADLKDSGLIRLRRSLVEVPELESLLMHPHVRGVVEAYFGSHFKVFACDIYRTFPEDPQAAAVKFSSLKWHFDNCPESLLKIMIYLTDTRKDTGAISLVPKPVSARLKRAGFWDRRKAAGFENDINQNAVYLEGPAGTVLFFSTHHCIHCATLPLTGYRDVAVFLVQPSLAPQPSFSPELRERYSRNYGYCVNPFFNTPQAFAD